MYPAEVSTTAGAGGQAAPGAAPQGRLCGLKCLRVEIVGAEDVVVTCMLRESSLEAVQDALTCVAANLPALRRWLGSDQSCRAQGLWRRGEENLYVSLSEVRELGSGRSLAAAAVVSMVCMATGRRPDSYTAITGDVDLRGHLRDVEGLWAKLEACRVKGVRTVVMPRSSYEGVDRSGWPQELRDYADRVVRGVTHVAEVLELSIEGASWTGRRRILWERRGEYATAGVRPSPRD